MGMIGNMFIKLSMNKSDFDKGINDAKKQTSSFGSAMGKIGGMIAGVFAVGQIVQFGKEVFQIATQAEGVITAFKKIGSSNDLDNLRRSVKGTVADLELMKRSVMASNFGIPVQQLGKLFEFASKRAQDTGQSVDYLVDSIVMGIGRKSPLILDNLGISAIQLREKLGSVSMEAATVADITRAVGAIAEESLTKTGRLADNLGTKVQSLSANWANLKMTISSLFSESQWISDDLDDWSKVIQIWQSKELSGWAKFLASISGAQMDKVIDKMEILKGLEQRESTDGGILDKKKDIVTVSERIRLLEKNIDIEKKLASQKNISFEESVNHANAIKKAEEELKALREIAGESAHKTNKEQLDDITKINKALSDEAEAQRILSQELKGESVQPMTSLYSVSGDFALSQESDTGGVFGNLDSHYDLIKEKFNKFSTEFNADAVKFTDDLNNIISSGIADSIGSLSSGLGELSVGAITGKDFGNQVLQTIGNFMVQMGMLFITTGSLFTAFEAAITSMNGPLALGIGVALVAAGSAVSGLAKKGLSGGASASPAASGYSNYSQSNATDALSGNVVFELQGTTLKGVLNNTDRRNNLIR